jgi:hypothetical protein
VLMVLKDPKDRKDQQVLKAHKVRLVLKAHQAFLDIITRNPHPLAHLQKYARDPYGANLLTLSLEEA